MPQKETEKKTVCQQTVSVVRLSFVEWRSASWREYTAKYFFQNISWNTYLAIVSLCKLPRNVHDALFEIFHELWKFWKSIFRISLSWKTLLLNLFPCLINSFVINDVYKSLKRKCKHYVKANKVVFLFYVTKFEGYWR